MVKEVQSANFHLQYYFPHLHFCLGFCLAALFFSTYDFVTLILNNVLFQTIHVVLCSGPHQQF